MSQRALDIHPWKIIEVGFDPADDRAVMASESLFSLGNGSFGGRANFEEHYSGTSLQGNYIGGVYYPDKTRVGWWKIGYPEYFAKVLNSAFWIGVDVNVNGETLDLAAPDIVLEDFHRELDMREGVLRRSFRVQFRSGIRLAVNATRFISMANDELAALRYEITVLQTPEDVPVDVMITPYINADVRNRDANYDEKFWEFVGLESPPFADACQSIRMRTRKTGFEVCWAQMCRLGWSEGIWQDVTAGERIAKRYVLELEPGKSVVLEKYVGVASSLNHEPEQLGDAASSVAKAAYGDCFQSILDAHKEGWRKRWEGCDVVIGGDEKAQQAIRYCIFQLLQTYTGHDSRLNVGPKGFTGEKYGGSTYWDTEAYCLPFYLCTSGEKVARQLLLYRYHQLDKAIENAQKLGFSGGAALYPMVTMNGEESHNEWEITFEEIHRNGAIAYAIYNYCRYTGSREYLKEGGVAVLIGIARFWAQRVSWSEPKQQYVILGVTGPNEYENNVNNNWYTNYLAAWCLRYAAESVEYTGLEGYAAEIGQWRDIADRIYLPADESLAVFLQQEGYLEKVQQMAADIPLDQRPINQHWSWDRILRSCFIKQADVLQGLYFFQEEFDEDTLARNFDFYEPRTVHESSLSSCVHTILAAKIGRKEKAYQLYLRAARLDLDDYNHEVHEGLHITSMAGSWLSVVEGFGGIRIGKDGLLHVTPRLPDGWESLRFKIRYRGAILQIEVRKDHPVRVVSENGVSAEIVIDGKQMNVE